MHGPATPDACKSALSDPFASGGSPMMRINVTDRFVCR
jgi:selenophosphate synthase